jgi:hypothetical protein
MFIKNNSKDKIYIELIDLSFIKNAKSWLINI